MPIDNIRRRGHHRGRIVDGVVHRRLGSLAQNFKGHFKQCRQVDKHLGRHRSGVIQVVVDGAPAELQRVGHGGAVNPVEVEQRGDGVNHGVKVTCPPESMLQLGNTCPLPFGHGW